MNKTKKMVVSGACLALCMLLPFLTGQIPQIGNAISPMHIPVLLCGFICGWQYGAVVGFAAPLLRFIIFGMPPIIPVGTAMAFELAAYGAISGVVYKLLPKKTMNLYLSLIVAMLGGRIVWGIAMYAITAANGGAFTLAAFMAGAFINAVPGIIIHIILIPIILLSIKKAGITFNE